MTWQLCLNHLPKLTNSHGSFVFYAELIFSSHHLQVSDTKRAPKTRGPNINKRRNGRKQKLSSEHDVSSEDIHTAGSQQHIAV
jgi:hypothetical protein